MPRSEKTTARVGLVAQVLADRRADVVGGQQRELAEAARCSDRYRRTSARTARHLVEVRRAAEDARAACASASTRLGHRLVVGAAPPRRSPPTASGSACDERVADRLDALEVQAHRARSAGLNSLSSACEHLLGEVALLLPGSARGSAARGARGSSKRWIDTAPSLSSSRALADAGRGRARALNFRVSWVPPAKSTPNLKPGPERGSARASRRSAASEMPIQSRRYFMNWMLVLWKNAHGVPLDRQRRRPWLAARQHQVEDGPRDEHRGEHRDRQDRWSA